MLLSTSGGVTEAGPAVHPYFFSGLLTEPAVAAAGMLACAAVARSRYFVPGSVLAAIINDPVVTSNGDRLRFESFSGCCGVHARLDLLSEALADPPLASGTTNIDEDRRREDNWSWSRHLFAVDGSGSALTMAGIFPARAWEAAKIIAAQREATGTCPEVRASTCSFQCPY